MTTIRALDSSSAARFRLETASLARYRQISDAYLSILGDKFTTPLKVGFLVIPAQVSLVRGWRPEVAQACAIPHLTSYESIRV